MRTVAVDWSGRKDASEPEHIWVAEVVGGRLVELRNGRTRAQVVKYLAGLDDARLLVGLDFAFSLPSWWMRAQGLTDVRDLWASVIDHGEPPFFGMAGSKRPAQGLFRRTDQALHAAKFHSKSPFQVAGAGAVGMGSLRGMPHLLTLAERFAVWPFDPPGPRTVLEIYPRALTGPVNKSRWTSRHAYLFQRFPEQEGALLERAAGSDDAFDAAVSALVMARELTALPAASDPDVLLEGWAWAPGVPIRG
jgi:hypothetical protein